MNATKAMELLKPVPQENFIVLLFTNHVDSCCATGHLMRLTSDDPDNYNLVTWPESSWNNCMELRESSQMFLKKNSPTFEDGMDIATVNNNKKYPYTEDNPKCRVMHLLRDMVKAGY